MDLLQSASVQVSLVPVSPELVTLLAHIQLVHQDLQVLFCKSPFQLFDTQSVLVNGVIPPQVQDMALPFELSCGSCWPILSKVFWMAAQLSRVSTTPPRFVSSATLLMMYSVHWEDVNEEVKQLAPVSMPGCTTRDCPWAGLCPAVVKWMSYRNQGVDFQAPLTCRVLFSPLP